MLHLSSHAPLFVEVLFYHEHIFLLDLLVILEAASFQINSR